MEPKQQPAELRELLLIIEEIRNASIDGVGNDPLSNAALELIRSRIDRAETVIRALDETSRFDMSRIMEMIRSTIRP